ncbi:hypothetical protein FRC03_010929 [Tulasnella sp. 419]|nr:hypothetical protein FRC02_011018 [Tulasnella sp. 418]KAG8966974.1 hypothetical protein FRC03_010929 [Tulasnella sp. 419]
MPRFRVLAGPSTSSLSPCPVNESSSPHSTFYVKTSKFEGKIVVNIKGFVDEGGTEKRSTYFERKDKKEEGVTWSVQVQGRFLVPVSCDDVLFGNTFDRPLKLPWGSGAALQFMSYIDPTLTHDLQSDRPWALSPLVSTMPHLTHFKHPSHEPLPTFDTTTWVGEDLSGLVTDGIAEEELNNPTKRRNYFKDQQKRKSVTLTTEDVLEMDFCYGFLRFPSLDLQLPGGISFDLKKYWDGQPVRFVCCERAKDGSAIEGETYWCVIFELVEEYGTDPQNWRTGETSEDEMKIPFSADDVD